MKKIFLGIITIVISFFMTSSCMAFSKNVLHTITLEKNDTSYNIILGTDTLTKSVKKSIKNNELVLDISGVMAAGPVDAIYKGANNINSLVIENISPNKLRVHIQADNIAQATIMDEPISGGTTIVGESFPIEKILWGIFVICLFAVIKNVIKNTNTQDEEATLKHNIKEREIKLYKTYTKELATTNLMHNNTNLSMRKIARKIDRKIDDRLTSVIK